MAWVLGDSLRPGEQPEFEILDDGLERIGAVEEKAWCDARHREPDNRYLLSRISWQSGIRLAPLSEPIRVRITRAYGPLREMFGVRIGPAITQRVVDAIEALEPGVHNYLPLDITMPDGSPVAEPRVLLNVCVRRDTIAVEESENLVEVWPNREERPSLTFYRGRGHLRGSQRRFHGAAAHAERIGGGALWYEYKLGVVMISDALAAALMEMGAIAHHGDYLDYIHPIREIARR